MNRVKQNGVWLSPEDNKKFMAKRFEEEHGIDINAPKKEAPVELPPEPMESTTEIEQEVVEEVVEPEVVEEEEEIPTKTKKILESLGIKGKPKKRGRPPKK